MLKTRKRRKKSLFIIHLNENENKGNIVPS
jgi:hypothetical protein